MSDLICENYPMLLVLSRFGISLGFGDKTIGEVCEDSGVDTKTFLTIVNLLLDDHTTAEQIDPSLSVEALGKLSAKLAQLFPRFPSAPDPPQADRSDRLRAQRRFVRHHALFRPVRRRGAQAHERPGKPPFSRDVRSLVQGKSGNGKYHIGIFSKQHDQVVVAAGRAQEYHHQILSGYREATSSTACCSTYSPAQRIWLPTTASRTTCSCR